MRTYPERQQPERRRRNGCSTDHFPDERKVIQRAVHSPVHARFLARFNLEIRNALEPFLEKYLQFDTGEK